MVLSNFQTFLKESSAGAVKVLKHSLIVIKDHPELTFYPYAAAFFVSITYPLVSTTIFAHWYQRVFQVLMS
jgi:hypothetical protein